jgi:hypothetical protein
MLGSCSWINPEQVNSGVLGSWVISVSTEVSKVFDSSPSNDMSRSAFRTLLFDVVYE